jgi:Domain of unknown function (DUF4126)
METGLATALGLAMASGFNAWAAALVFGGCARLFPSLLWGPAAEFFRSGPILTIALILFVAEFLADKIPSLEHFWNLAHTFLRPAAGAGLALACVPRESWIAKIGVAFLGAAVTLVAHMAKATSRFTSTAAVSGLGQFSISVAEDVIAVSIAAVAIFAPTISLAVLFGVVILMWILFSRVRRAAAILFFIAAHPRRAFRSKSEIPN